MVDVLDSQRREQEQAALEQSHPPLEEWRDDELAMGADELEKRIILRALKSGRLKQLLDEVGACAEPVAC